MYIDTNPDNFADSTVHDGRLSLNGVYALGNSAALQNFFNEVSGVDNASVLYFGDHMRTDLLSSKL